MKSIFTFIIAAFLLFPLQAQEKVYTVDNLPKVHLQNKMQYVCNPAGILSQAACDSIDAMLYALEQQTGIETVVAVELGRRNGGRFESNLSTARRFYGE